MIEGQEASKWLSKVTKDQNLEDIDDITLTPVSGFRRWFASRILGHNLHAGWYNPTTDRIVLGPRYTIYDVDVLKDVVCDTDTTSVASKEWTVTTGEQWIILRVYGKNATRAINSDCRITPLGGAETNIGERIIAGAVNRGVAYGVGYAPLIVLDGGDKIKIEDLAFVAADVMTFSITYAVVN